MVVATNLHCQIFVGGLNDSVSDEQLRQFFSPYGQLVHVKILVGKRCGLVHFADSHCADVALKMLNGTQLGGQNIRLSWGRSPSNKQVASSKIIQNKQSGQPECCGPYGFVEFVSHAAAGRALQAYNGSLMPNVEQNDRLNWASFGAGESRSDGTPDFTIFVGDLTSETSRPHYPSVKGAKVVSDRLTGRTKGYGFVRFGDEREKLHAMSEMNGEFCSTRPMHVGPTANQKNVAKAAISCRHVVKLHG